MRILSTFLNGLRFPYLFVLVLAVFGFDLVLPDVLPFADEVLLGLATALLAAWRRKKDRPDEESSELPSADDGIPRP